MTSNFAFSKSDLSVIDVCTGAVDRSTNVYVVVASEILHPVLDLLMDRRHQ